MEDYRQSAEKVISKGKMILSKKRKIRMNILKCTVTAASVCCAIALFFGISAQRNRSIVSDTADMITANIYTAPSAVTEITAQTAAVTSHTSAVTKKTVSETTATRSHEDIIDEYYSEYSGETPQLEAPVTERSDKEAPTEAAANTDVTEPTLPTRFEKQEIQFPRLADIDDPIWVFPNITYGGIDYTGCGYMKKNIADGFYTPWREESSFTAYDPKREGSVTEPVTIMGLRSLDEEQEYIIVCFERYGLYALYSADTEEETGPETEPFAEAEADITNAIDNE